MIKTKQYKTQIIELYRSGVKPTEIAKILKFPHHQPVYNLLNKEKLLIPLTVRGQSKYTLDKDFFKVIDTEEKAYILGFVCADGHIGKDRLVISLSIKDKEILEKISKCLNSNVPFKECFRKNPYVKGKEFCHMVRVQYSSMDLVDPLFKMGLTSDKTYTLTSAIIKNVPEPLMRHFLRGYFDGDGNVLYGIKYSSGTKYNINVCGNKEFLENTFNKYFPSPNKLYYETKSKQMFVWKLSSKENVRSFLNYLYCDSKIYLQRKHEIYEHAHLKQEELLGTPTLERQKDNQQPSLISNDFEGSTTNSQIQTDNAEDSNANTSILQLHKTIDDIV